ncbi:hypothetical protein [Halorussus litoreus]|uniref:hypothetical protein n=1 Tax=Halorussus litoreus TaxID=1710536 RepID=UPI000E229130|nr:hypothetical protein [Halorussus litoreus]
MADRSRSWGLVRPEFGCRLDLLVVALAVSLAGIHLYLGVTEARPPFVVAGIGFLVGVAVFPTRLFRPVLYLVGVAYAFVLGVVWALDGMTYPTFGVATGAISVAFVAVVVYRFLDESR